MKTFLLSLMVFLSCLSISFAQAKEDSLWKTPSVEKSILFEKPVLKNTKPLSKFIELVDVDLGNFQAHRVKLTGKSSFWKSFTGQYNERYQRYLQEQPYLQVLYPNYNYPSGYTEGFFNQYISPTPFD